MADNMAAYADSPGEALIALVGLMEGLQVLHREEITHGDIKLDNVMVRRYLTYVALGDFGACTCTGALAQGSGLGD